MNQKIKSLIILSALSFAATWAVAKEQVIIYPNAESPLFSIEVPGNWTLTQAQAEDQFFLASGPAGVEMWFRAKPMTSEKEFEGAIDAAIASGREWFLESYTDVVLAAVVISEFKGMPYASAKGTGVSKATGDVVAFSMAFASMPNGALAQLWAIIPEKDAKGFKYAEKVVESFTAL